MQALAKLFTHTISEFFRRREIEDIYEILHNVRVSTPPVRLIPEPLHGLLVEFLTITDVECVPKF